MFSRLHTRSHTHPAMHATLALLLGAAAGLAADMGMCDGECSALLQVAPHLDLKVVKKSESSKDDSAHPAGVSDSDSADNSTMTAILNTAKAAGAGSTAQVLRAASDAAQSIAADLAKFETSQTETVHFRPVLSAKARAKQTAMKKNVSNSRALTTPMKFDTRIKLQLECSGDNFADCWEWYTGPDPTDGYVEYVSQAEADQLGIYKVNSSKGKGIYLGATTGRGGEAKSIRLASHQTFTRGLFIIDIEHMPTGLGTWPAWWSFGPDWPNNGEIDTIETVSGSNTHSTLHTKAGCYARVEDVSDGGDCNSPGDGDNGCGVTGGKNGPGTVPPHAGGQTFNDQGGGVYATWWTEHFIAMYFFPRSQIPNNIINKLPDPLTWGEPYVSFPLGWGASCEYQYFANHQMVINLDFCGSWAGAVFPGSAGYSAGAAGCEQYVAANDLSDTAFWLINSVNVYHA